jgi:hypothetical protein
MAFPLLIQLLLVAALQVVSFLLAPKPKKNKSEKVKDLESPTAESGRPIPVLFGSKPIKGLNVLHYSDKSKKTFKVKA